MVPRGATTPKKWGKQKKKASNQSITNHHIHKYITARYRWIDWTTRQNHHEYFDRQTGRNTILVSIVLAVNDLSQVFGILGNNNSNTQKL